MSSALASLGHKVKRCFSDRIMISLNDRCHALAVATAAHWQGSGPGSQATHEWSGALIGVGSGLGRGYGNRAPPAYPHGGVEGLRSHKCN